MIHHLTIVFYLAICAVATVHAETKLKLGYAQNFTITDHETHRILTIHNALKGTEAAIHYALVSKSNPLPDLPKNLQVIRTPVERVVVMETVYIGYLGAINQLDTIVGAGSVNFISNPEVQSRVGRGDIQNVQAGQGLDIERMLLLQPDLILSSISSDPAFDISAKLARSGLTVVLTAGYMEGHPLARAEWIKFIAAFFEEDAQADTVFTDVETRYTTLQATVAQAANKPTVFCGAPYSGAWHVAAGESYTARAIRDAGGDYLWSDVARAGALALDTERVFLKAANADIWLNPSFFRSLDELLTAEARFGKFRAAQIGAVFNNTKQVGSNGGNAIWEEGIVRPDKVLADMIALFHPELMPDHQFVFYEQLK